MTNLFGNRNWVWIFILLGIMVSASIIFVLNLSLSTVIQNHALWVVIGFTTYAIGIVYFHLHIKIESLRLSDKGQEINLRNQAYENRVPSNDNHLVYFDHLTELSTRALLVDRLQQSMKRTPWNKRLLAVMHINLVKFKTINDTFGHGTGDRLLKAVGQRLQNSVRDGDTVARLDADEFAIGLIDIASKNDISLIADKIVNGLSDTFTIFNRKITIDASIGISLFPDDCDSVDKLLQYADIAMCHTRSQAHYINYQFYNDQIGTPASQLRDLQNDLTHALDREEFIIYYQPRVNIETGSIQGMEALIRWHHPVHGLILPNDFIPHLEKTGLIVPVGSWVLHTACQQSKSWLDAGFGPLRISVNVSARQFIQHDLVQDVKSALTESDLDPRLLELEITESVLMAHMEQATEILHQIHALNVSISLDDFGTGYSSLDYLKRFPISTLKIDRSFICNLMTNPSDAALTKAVIAMARYLNLGVIAEGVEHQQQVEFLSKYNCDEMQGFLFSKPIPAEIFTRLLQDTPRFELDFSIANKKFA